MRRREFIHKWVLRGGVLVPFVAPKMVRAATVIPGPSARGFKAAAASYIFDENCEGTGTPTDWANVGTPDWDHTGTVLDGAESLQCDNARAHYNAGAAYDEFWVRFKWRTNSTAGPIRVFSWRHQTGDAEVAWIEMTAGNKLGVADGTKSAGTATSLAINTTYNVWGRYKKGTGSNAEITCAFSTTNTEPTSGSNEYAEVLDGVKTSQVNRFQFRATNIQIFDRMTGNNAAIGNF